MNSIKFIKIKIAILFLFIISFLSLTKVFAATWQFVWFNTTIEIPVGKSLDDYKNIPYANLLKDGVVMTDAIVDYSKDGDTLYPITSVDTTTIGSYKVLYKAYENTKYKPGTCNGYKTYVIFNVVDNVKPTINVISDEISIKKVNSIDDSYIASMEEKIASNFLVTDNTNDVEVTITHQIDYTVVGNYSVTVKAVDKSGNFSSKVFYVSIYDDKAPVLTFKSGDNYLIVSKDSYVNLGDYVIAIDDIDGDVTSNITFPYVSTDVVGIYEYEINVSDSSGNTSSITVQVEVKDDQAPVINLNQTTLILDYKTDFTTFDFTRYLDSAYDGDTNLYNDVSITYDMEARVGNFHIWYSVSDGVNTTTKSILVKLVSKEAPKITISDFTVLEDSNVDLKDYVTVYDPSDEYVSETLEIDTSNVDFSNEGVYYASVYVVNSSGLSTTKTMRVEVIDKSAFSKVNLPLFIILMVLSAITIGYIGFFVYYFILKKKITIKINKNNDSDAF